MRWFLALVLMFTQTDAQQTPNIEPLYIQGTPIIGHCMQWVNGNTITDSGVSC